MPKAKEDGGMLGQLEKLTEQKKILDKQVRDLRKQQKESMADSIIETGPSRKGRAPKVPY